MSAYDFNTFTYSRTRAYNGVTLIGFDYVALVLSCCRVTGNRTCPSYRNYTSPAKVEAHTSVLAAKVNEQGNSVTRNPSVPLVGTIVAPGPPASGTM